MVEFEVDMACLLEDGELDRMVLHDENGEHPSMQFEPSRGECRDVSERRATMTCSVCGQGAQAQRVSAVVPVRSTR